VVMDIEDVRKRLKGIEDVIGDDKVAHSKEDDLYTELLRSIAYDNCENPRECAREAIKATEMDFAR